MKNTRLYLFLLVCWCCTGKSFAQENPLQELGYDVKFATLSKGKYKEFFENDSLVRIGSVIFNTYTNTVLGFVEEDTVYSENSLDPQIISRWLSPDPASDEYTSFSPYNFVSNNPVIYIDPDGQRFYFAAGAAHDPGKTGYISMMINTFKAGGIQNPVDIHAHRGKMSDVMFTNGINSEVPYYKSYQIPAGDPTMAANGITTDFQNAPDSRITEAVGKIRADLNSNPLEKGEQFNLSGYSTGSVTMAQAALMIAGEGQVVDNLVLIGSTIKEGSELHKALMSNENIKNVIVVNISGDNVKDGAKAVFSFLKQGDNHPHFKYAFGEDAKKNTEELVKYLKEQGVK